MSTEFLQDATPVLFVCPVLFSVSFGLSLSFLFRLHGNPHVISYVFIRSFVRSLPLYRPFPLDLQTLLDSTVRLMPSTV